LNNLDLVDIQVSSRDDAVELLHFIIGCTRTANLEFIECWASVHHFVHNVLEDMGFVNSGPVTYFGGRELEIGQAPMGWRDFSNWYVQMGDSDIY
jgi:hypothetical protein